MIVIRSCWWWLETCSQVKFGGPKTTITPNYFSLFCKMALSLWMAHLFCKWPTGATSIYSPFDLLAFPVTEGYDLFHKLQDIWTSLLQIIKCNYIKVLGMNLIWLFSKKQNTNRFWSDLLLPQMKICHHFVWPLIASYCKLSSLPFCIFTRE